MKVFITRKVFDCAVDRLRSAGLDVDMYERDERIPREELLLRVRGTAGIFSFLHDRIDAEVMDSAGEHLQIIANFAVGYDNIDIDEAKRRGIVVTNTPGVLTDATAELAWALLLSTARLIVPADRFTREGKFTGWSPTLMLGMGITGKTLGVIGAGRIGTAMALKSKGFEMRVLYTSRRDNELLNRELSAIRVELDTLVEESDFISIHTSLTPETHHLIGERELRMMKRDCVLVNTARGAVIDERALLRALRERWIFGAGLDVYEFEPKITEGLCELENVVLLPHIGSATREVREKMATMAAEEICRVLSGKEPINRVV